MTFRHATLIHKRRQQQLRRRIIPAATLTAAALVAVVLFLATAGAARAASPQESPSLPPACDGLRPITLTASTAGTVRGANAAPSGNCSIELDLSVVAAPVDGAQQAVSQPCVVTATPRSSVVRGARVLVGFNGGCDRVRVGLRIDVAAISQSPDDDPVANGSSTGLTTVHAEVLGNDVVGLDLFYSRVVTTWEHSSTNITSAYYQPSTWDRDTPTNWTVESVSHYGRQINRQLYRAVQVAWFHIHIPIIADTRAYTHITLDAKPGGAFSCDFGPSYWINPYFNAFFEFTCEPQ